MSNKCINVQKKEFIDKARNDILKSLKRTHRSINDTLIDEKIKDMLARTVFN